MTPIYDRAAALSRIDGDESFLEELIELFLVDSPRLLLAVREAVAAADASRLMRAAHSLKGSIANFESPSAYEAALRLEQIGASGHLESAEQALINLERIIDQLASTLARPAVQPQPAHGEHS